MKHDPIELIETAYSAEPGLGAWLRKISVAMRPLFERGEGILVVPYDARDFGRVRMGEPVLLGCSDAYYRFALATTASMTTPTAARVYGGDGALTTYEELVSREAPDTRAIARRIAQEYGFFNGAVAQVLDPTGLGFWIGAPFSSQWKPTRRDKTRWSRVAAHLAAAYRLQRQGSPGASPVIDEAILDPDGKIQHAEASARDPGSRSWLRRAALAMDRARTTLRREDGDEALAVWEGLVAGRWSLVDRFDSDGRRFLVARKNDPAAAVSTTLTPREQQMAAYAALGHSNKLIAYELGLSASSVSERLKSACSKLGVRSRAELIMLLRGGGMATDGSPELPA